MDRIEVFHERNKFYPQQNCSALKRCQYLHLYCFVIAVWIFLKTVIKWIPLKLDQTSLEMPKQSSWHSFALFFLLTPKSLPPLTYGLQDLGREGQGDRGNLHVSLVNNFLFILFLTAIMFYLERNVVGKNCIQGNQAGLFHFTPAMFVFLSVVCEILMQSFEMKGIKACVARRSFSTNRSCLYRTQGLHLEDAIGQHKWQKWWEWRWAKASKLPYF